MRPSTSGDDGRHEETSTGRGRRSRTPARRSPCRCPAASPGDRRASRAERARLTAGGGGDGGGGGGGSGVDTAGHGTERDAGQAAALAVAVAGGAVGARLADGHEHLDDELAGVAGARHLPGVAVGLRWRRTSRDSRRLSGPRRPGRLVQRRADEDDRRRRRRPSPASAATGRAPASCRRAGRGRGSGAGDRAGRRRRDAGARRRRTARRAGSPSTRYASLIARHRLGIGRRPGRGGGGGRGAGRRRGSQRPWRRRARPACRSGWTVTVTGPCRRCASTHRRRGRAGARRRGSGAAWRCRRGGAARIVVDLALAVALARLEVLGHPVEHDEALAVAPPGST